MSSIRSTSSRTRMSIRSREQLPCSMWSSSRPGRRRQDVHAPAQIGGLLSVADAPVDDGHPQVGEKGVLMEGLLDLEGELAGRLEDEAAHRAVAAEPLDDRQGEGGRLPGAGLGRADDVAALEDEGNGLDLDGRRLGVALLLYGIGQGIREAELRKRGVHLRDVDRDGRLLRRPSADAQRSSWAGRGRGPSPGRPGPPRLRPRPSRRRSSGPRSSRRGRDSCVRGSWARGSCARAS